MADMRCAEPLENGLRSNSTRFTDLLRELATEHANEVRALSRGLQEARAEVDRLRKAEGTACSTMCPQGSVGAGCCQARKWLELSEPPGMQLDGISHLFTTSDTAEMAFPVSRRPPPASQPFQPVPQPFQKEVEGRSEPAEPLFPLELRATADPPQPFQHEVEAGREPAEPLFPLELRATADPCRALGLAGIADPTQGVAASSLEGDQQSPIGSPNSNSNEVQASRGLKSKKTMLMRTHGAGSDSLKSMAGTMTALYLKFDMVIGTCIVINALVMAMEIEYYGLRFKQETLEDCVGTCGQVQALETAFAVLEHLFTATFLLELVVRIWWEGAGYLCHVVNGLDAAIVAVSIIDSWVLGPLGDDSIGNVAVLRLVRLLKLAKVLRVVRVMKAFSSLRVLVGAVANSVGALAWSMTLLFVLELIGAIFMAQVLTPFMEDDSTDFELREFIFNAFGTWSNAMFTIFEVTMAPGGFMKYRRLYQEVHPLFGVFFVIYVCIVTFAVVRVITALFLKATLAASSADEHVMAQNRAKEHTDYVCSLRELLTDDDLCETKIGEFDYILKPDLYRRIETDKTFKAWLSEVHLDPSHVRRIYAILEKGGRGVVLFDDWADAVLAMARPAQHVDSVISCYEGRSMFRRVVAVEQMIRDQFQVSGSREALSSVHLAGPQHTTLPCAAENDMYCCM